MELTADGNTAGAIAAFRRAIELKPDFEKAHYNLGIALRAQGETSAAKKELDDLNALHEFRARLAQSKYLTLQGVEALKQQKLDDALALFQKSIEQSPDLPTGHYYLGVTWSANKTRHEPWRPMRKRFKLKPDYAQAHTSLGLLYWRQNDSKRALEEFRQAVMSDPDLAEAHYNLGLAAGATGRLEEAAGELMKPSVSIPSTLTPAYNWDWS